MRWDVGLLGCWAASVIFFVTIHWSDILYFDVQCIRMFPFSQDCTSTLVLIVFKID